MHNITVIEDETMLLLRGYGLSDSVIPGSEDDHDYAIEVELDGYINEVIRLRDMFSPKEIADTVFDHHKRFVKSGDFDNLRITVRDPDNGVIYERNTNE